MRLSWSYVFVRTSFRLKQALDWQKQWRLAAAALTAVYQFYLCKDRDWQGCFKAFLNNIWFGGFVFAGLFLTDAFGFTGP